MSTDDEARALFAALQAGEAGGLLGALSRRGQRRAAAFDFATAEIDAWDPQLPAEAAWDGLLAAEDRRSGARAAEGLLLEVEPTAAGWRARVVAAPEGWSLWWAEQPRPLEPGAVLHLEGDHPWLVLGPEGEELTLRPR